MKLGRLRCLLDQAIAAGCGDDAEVEATGLYSSSGNIEEVTWEKKIVHRETSVNGKVTETVDENHSTVCIKTDICTG